jgi:ATP-binding cassette, subfamily B, bacterial PglK
MDDFGTILKFRQALSVYSKNDKKKLILVALSQVLLALLDLLGVVLLGVIGALSVYGIQSKSPGSRINWLLDSMHLEDYSFQQQVAILGVLAVFVLVFKTIVSVLIVRKTLLFASKKGALISSKLVADLFSKSIIELNKYNNQQIVFSITSGVEYLTTRVIGNALLIFSDVVLLLVLFIGLLFINTSISISIFVFFTIIGYSLFKIMKKSSYKLGTSETALTIMGNEKILEFLNSYRELTVKNRRGFYIDQISNLRMDVAFLSAKRNFMPYLSKYVFETALILGTFAVAGIQFTLYNSSQAIASLAIFLAAGTRIAPAILRVQQSSINLRLGLGTVENTLEMIENARKGHHDKITNSENNFNYDGFIPTVKIENLNFSYEDNTSFSIKDLNLNIEEGTQVAITGSSGAGKTTLIDLLLGVHGIESNSIRISGQEPLNTFKLWPGAVAYVPQNITIMNGTIRDNISQGYPKELADDDRIWQALDTAQLSAFVKNLPHGLQTEVGEYGNKLSGGQRQRLGIARALFTSPKLLILDEATSALDGETEAAISETIQKLKGKTTVILIAHRISSVKNADKIVFMEHGRITAEGSFDEVRQISPTFENQVNLMQININN